MVPRDELFMREALLEAGEALKNGDVPVGAVIVRDGEVISRGHNVREAENDALGHAEIQAIRGACRSLGDWRLQGCTIYVTLEPCVMCTGACINSRLDRIVFGAYDKKAGCCGSIADLTALHLDSEPDVFGGILQEECEEILKEFFLRRREDNG
ncbi:MAG: nucleoside deaminase [Oscillospiraceae bacterium]|nr:nucleoside deaminase [Oscillospiraceae bacterium]